jgi:hypothetical protein
MDKKTYEFPLQLKTIEENGYFSGYASVFNVEDNHNDIILSGAFGNSLRKKHYGKDIKLLWQHKSDEPIGTFTKLVEDEHGLYVEGKLLLDVQRAKEAYALIKNGAVKGLSIGFIVKQYDRNDDGARRIYEADLWEISLVTFPANKYAEVMALKSCQLVLDKEMKLESSIDKAINILRN